MRQLTLREAETMLGMKSGTLRKQANRGVLRAYKLPNGRDWIIDYDEIKRYEREHRRVRNTA